MLENIKKLNFRNESDKINDKTKYIIEIKLDDSCVKMVYQFFDQYSAFKFIHFLKIMEIKGVGEYYFTVCMPIDEINIPYTQKFCDRKRVSEHPTLYDKFGVKLNFKYFMDKNAGTLLFQIIYPMRHNGYRVFFDQAVRPQDTENAWSSFERKSFKKCLWILEDLREWGDLFLEPTVSIHNQDSLMIDSSEFSEYVTGKEYPSKPLPRLPFPKRSFKLSLLDNPWIIFYLLNYLPICTKNDQ